MGIIGTETGRDVLTPSLFPCEGGIDEAETASLDRCTEIVCLSFLETRSPCSDIYRTGSTKIACRLEYLRLLSVVQRYLLNIVKRETTEVHKSVLCIAQLYAIVENAHVVGAHTSNVDGLQSSHTAIILYLHTAEIA